MKMRRLVVIALVLSMLLAIPVVANAASPAPGGPFSTAFRVQNLDTANASCVYVFYDANGTAAFTSAGTTITPGDSLFVYTPSVSGLSNGTYSGVVSCDKKVAAVVNFSDADSGASHNGINTPATTWYAPGIYNNFYGFYSNIVVQNATSGSIDVTVEYYAPGNSSPVASETKPVPAFASVPFEQEGNSALSAGTSYSAKIVGTGDVAAVVNIYGSGAEAAQLYSYNPFSNGSRISYAPVIMSSYYTNDTAVTVQNIGSNATNVKVTYGSGQVTDHSVPAGSSVSLYTPAEGVPANVLTGAKIESDASDIVVLVNESNTNGRAASYAGFASGSTDVSAPIVMNDYYGFSSSVTCQNVGANPTTLAVSYSNISNPFATGSVAAGASALIYQPANADLTPGYIGSALISSTAGEPIVCVVNQDLLHGPNKDLKADNQYAYEGIAK